jgi:hypothetical protein
VPVEIVGEAGTAGASREWIDAECQLAIKHLIKVCGEPHPKWNWKFSGRSMSWASIP